jgi:SulP family sulfate permease
MCSAVNDIDSSAVESLVSLIWRLTDRGVKLHLSEVKAPVMDRLKRSTFMQTLTGRVFLSQYDAFRVLAPGVCDSKPLKFAENIAGDGI